MEESSPPHTTAAEKIIVALDVSTEEAALGLVQQLGDQISFFKVGLQLYTAAGPGVVRKIRNTGARVFLDLKLHDIPNTVAGAVQSAADLGVDMLTVHLSGGGPMLSAAATASSGKVLLLGVTVLTSINEKTLHQIGVNSDISSQVQRLARVGLLCGIDGLVASAHEIKMLRQEFGTDVKIVVPGIRPAGTEADDQRRTLTPQAALEAGADYLVVGRPITAARDPRHALTKMLAESGG